MRAGISRRAAALCQGKSPVREIMDYADPDYIRGLGLNPDDLISFAGGWVDHSAPADMQRQYKWIAEHWSSFHQSGAYSPTEGLLECRQAIADYECLIYGMDLRAKNVIVGLGSTQLMGDLLTVLLDPGDRVLLLNPSYCNYPLQVAAAGGEIVRSSVLNPLTWECDFDAGRITSDIVEHEPKVILLVSPDNPTSQVLPDEYFYAAYSAACAIGSVVVVDFAYKDLVFENVPDYFSWIPDDNFVSVHSNSKWSRSLGRRLGWVEASDLIVEAMGRAQSISILCPDTLHQMVLASYLNWAITEEELRPYIESVRHLYRKAAECTVHAIRESLKVPCLKPQGGIYTCIKVGIDGAKFVRDVLKGTGVLFVPGWGFGGSMRDAVRVSYGPLVNDLNRIEEGMARVGRFLCR